MFIFLEPAADLRHLPLPPARNRKVMHILFSFHLMP
jgi:hypothetical protein